MSFNTFIGLTILSAILSLGQWVFFKLTNKKPSYFALFISLVLANVGFLFTKSFFKC